MKVLEWPFAILIAVIVILIAIGILLNFFKQLIFPELKVKVDVRYACFEYNNSEITYENFKILLYGFLTGQCNNFFANLSQGITLDDIRRTAKEIDEEINVIDVDFCKLPSVNSYSVYVCCNDVLDAGKTINITRREIINSDVLICKVG